MAENNNEQIAIVLSGRIDSTNAAQTESDIMAQLAGKGEVPVTLDASKLEYISSAGLRVLMKVRKEAKKMLEVRNASPEIYDIFDTTGFTELFTVSKKMREQRSLRLSFLPCP